MSVANVKPRKRRPEPKDRLDAAELAGRVDAEISYQLLIEVRRAQPVTVGRLGTVVLPAGRYLYTGSARRNLEARIARHLRRDKPLRWHIDYLLAAKDVVVLEVRRSPLPECALNQATPGRVLWPGFGASDCRAGCGSHLKFLG